MEQKRRPQWRGERKPVMVRLPVDVAGQLADEAESAQSSSSAVAASLIAQGLGDLAKRHGAR